jgi:hypothetical protein
MWRSGSRGGNILFWVDTYYVGEPDVREDERGSVAVDDEGGAWKTRLRQRGGGAGKGVASGYCIVRSAHLAPSRMPNRRIDILSKLGANSDSNGRAGPEFAADWSRKFLLGIAARRRRRRQPQR